MSAWILALFTAVTLPVLSIPSTNGCVFHHNAVVHLGQVGRGSVNVFTSRFALLAAAHGDIESGYRHLYQVAGGTRAATVDCSPKYGLLGVRIVDGPMRGRYGWMTIEQTAEYGN